MTEELVQLLERQTGAVRSLEARMRALELLVAAREQRFVSVALEELEQAAEHLAALELGRVMVMESAGFGADVRASQLVEAADPDVAGQLRTCIDDLRVATDRLADARERAMAVTGQGAQEIRRRLEAAQVLGVA